MEVGGALGENSFRGAFDVEREWSVLVGFVELDSESQFVLLQGTEGALTIDRAHLFVELKGTVGGRPEVSKSVYVTTNRRHTLEGLWESPGVLLVVGR